MRSWNSAKVDWGKTNRKILEMAVAQYLRRLDDTANSYTALESKARWVLGTTLPVTVAIVGYVFTRLTGEVADEVWALIALAALLGTSAAFAAWSVRMATYYGAGITPVDAVVSDWADLLLGGKLERRQFLGLQLVHLAEAIRANTIANKRKEALLRPAIWFALSAVPAAAAVLFVLRRGWIG